MATVLIAGWKKGFEKVSHTQALESAGLSLTEAKSITDAVLSGQSQSVTVASASAAHSLAAQLQALGAIASAKE